MGNPLVAPTRMVGAGPDSSLKVTFWNFNLPECEVTGDPGYLSVVLHVGGGRIWRNNDPTPGEPGAVGMQPFEATRWRFEGAVSYLPIYLPFALLDAVSASLFDRDLKHEQLSVPPGTRDQQLCRAMRTVRSGCLSTIEPTNLILDSWSLILSEILVRRFSGNAGKYARSSFGKLPSRGVALVIDYIEANLDQDLRLAALAREAAMSTYHFAHRFRETVGVSPHAYIVGRRIRRAQDMLRHGTGSLAHVAMACGFSSQAHFTTAFQRRRGMTPGEFRRTAADCAVGSHR